MLKDKCVVYWIHIDEHTSFYKEGYIGITNNLERRIKDHSKADTIVGNAIRKHGDKISTAILFEGSREECLEKEGILRNKTRIGWNLDVGGRGGKYIGGYWKGKKRGKPTKEHLEKLSIVRKGKRNRNGTGKFTFLITDPTGKKHTVKSLVDFSKEFNIGEGCLRQAAKRGNKTRSGFYVEVLKNE